MSAIYRKYQCTQRLSHRRDKLKPFSPTTRMIRSREGLSNEMYLTMPRQNGKRGGLYHRED